MTDQLTRIYDASRNIIEWERDISSLSGDINTLLRQKSRLQVIGDKEYIMSQLIDHTPIQMFSTIYEDISVLLSTYSELSDVKEYDFLLTTIDDNMCTQFHYDMNKLRLLCTYAGQGTLWLSNSNVNWPAFQDRMTQDEIVIDKDEVHQAKTGSIVILKGAHYNQGKTPPVVHRSPPTQQLNETRLLLRIDSKREALIR
jgi:hypothetical protein